MRRMRKLRRISRVFTEFISVDTHICVSTIQMENRVLKLFVTSTWPFHVHGRLILNSTAGHRGDVVSRFRSWGHFCSCGTRPGVIKRLPKGELWELLGYFKPSFTPPFSRSLRPVSLVLSKLSQYFVSNPPATDFKQYHHHPALSSICAIMIFRPKEDVRQEFIRLEHRTYRFTKLKRQWAAEIKEDGGCKLFSVHQFGWLIFPEQWGSWKADKLRRLWVRKFSKLANAQRRSIAVINDRRPRKSQPKWRSKII